MEGTIYLYGDSLLKATVPDASFRYHFHAGELLGSYGAQVVNRAKMGATVRKGRQLVQHDVDRGLVCRYALVAYGGNDSDFDWQAVSADPEGGHLPRTELGEFARILGETVALLRCRGVQPLLMTLPPIDAGRYLDFICRGGGDRGRILRWLGDCQRIYRQQELYSDTVAQVAAAERVPLIPVRRAFLASSNCAELISPDGIHLNLEGYRRLFDTIAGWLRENGDRGTVPQEA